MKGSNKRIIVIILSILIIVISLLIYIEYANKENNLNNTTIASNAEQKKYMISNILENNEETSKVEYSIEWQKSVGSDYITEFKSAVKTPDGGIIAVGSTDANTSIEENPKKGYGNQDGIIVKYDYDGKIEWSKILGGAGSDELFEITTNSDGSKYAIVGHVSSANLKYDNSELNIGLENGFGKTDGFVMVIDEKGNKQWEKIIGGKRNDRINSAAINENGDVAVTGSYYGDITVNGTDETLTSSGEKDGFVCVFSNDGTYKWSKNLDSTQDVWGKAITATSNGFAVGVNFKGELTIGEETKEDNKITSKGQVDAVVIGFSAEGEEINWTRQLSSTENDEIYDITRYKKEDEESGIAVVGAYGAEINDDDINLEKISRASYDGNDYDGFLVKLGEDGSVKESVPISGNYDGVIDSVVPTNNGGLLLGGWTYSNYLHTNSLSIGNSGQNDGIIMELDSSNALVWYDVIKGELYDCINDIVYMGDGSYYAVGDFNSKSIKSGNESIKKDEELQDGVLLKNNSSYESDAFVIKYIDNTYEPPAGKVTVHHMLKEANGETIEKEELKKTLSGKIGETYVTEEEEIEHYTLENKTANATGSYAKGNIDVYYYYVPKDYDYKIEYYYDNEIDASSTKTKTAKYNSVVTEFENVSKNGYKLARVEPSDEQDKTKPNLQITGDSERDIIKIYYENAKFKTIKIKKEWVMSDEEAENYRATIKLMGVINGKKEPFKDKDGKEITVQIVGNHAVDIDNLPVYKGGNEMEYMVEEIKIEKRTSENNENWKEVSPTQFNVSYKIEKGNEYN